jgi:protein-S-isoprenylcysteine O-methyltransferase Ste14
MLLALILYLAHKHSRILMEEAHLERSFGRLYGEYRHAVGRYFPRHGARPVLGLNRLIDARGANSNR